MQVESLQHTLFHRRSIQGADNCRLILDTSFNLATYHATDAPLTIGQDYSNESVWAWKNHKPAQILETAGWISQIWKSNAYCLLGRVAPLLSLCFFFFFKKKNFIGSFNLVDILFQGWGWRATKFSWGLIQLYQCVTCVSSSSGLLLMILMVKTEIGLISLSLCFFFVAGSSLMLKTVSQHMNICIEIMDVIADVEVL